MVLEFTEIESITKIGTQDYYDIEVPDTECYFAQDILHHNSGKDRTIAKLLTYLAYKLLCLKNPQGYLREVYNCSIGDGDAIDIANMSINAKQAQNVFFKKLKQIVKNTKDPNTGKNWFEKYGIDLRDGYGIQNNEIKFSDSISAHSLNSETNTGEGLNLFFAIIDEFGSFPVNRALELKDAIEDSITSRFKRIGKMSIISYKYKNNDAMEIIYKKGKDDPDIYSSKAATYEVNPKITKKDLAKKYRTNPEKAKMTYECSGEANEGGYVSMPFMLNKMFDPNFMNPVIGNLISVDAAGLRRLKFKDWFKGTSGRIYTFRADMGTGKKDVGRDCAGLTICHVEKMYPQIDEKMKKMLAKEGIIIEFGSSKEIATRKGVVIDLALQLVAKNGNEIQFSDVREFILRLKNELNFNIVFGSYDRWQSKDSIQILNKNGIDVIELSVDRSNKPYDDWKELMYQQLIKCYPHPIAYRESKELEIGESGKVDHPEKSWERLQTEGTDLGSKDVMDTIAGASEDAMERIPLEADIFFV